MKSSPWFGTPLFRPGNDAPFLSLLLTRRGRLALLRGAASAHAALHPFRHALDVLDLTGVLCSEPQNGSCLRLLYLHVRHSVHRATHSRAAHSLAQHAAAHHSAGATRLLPCLAIRLVSRGRWLGSPLGSSKWADKKPRGDEQSISKLPHVDSSRELALCIDEKTHAGCGKWPATPPAMK